MKVAVAYVTGNANVIHAIEIDIVDAGTGKPENLKTITQHGRGEEPASIRAARTLMRLRGSRENMLPTFSCARDQSGRSSHGGEIVLQGTIKTPSAIARLSLDDQLGMYAQSRLRLPPYSPSAP